ncbi:MAG: tetratricopeptide repeat protein [Promethearchaeota archaeon]
MYKRFEPSEQVFVDREEYLEWMDEALKRCEDKSVVLHLRGIGGIGKSSLLDYWTSTIASTIRLDCQQYSEFYARLNILAKGAVRLGVQLPRFDVLWQIRQRFVEGVEPVREEGREWAKEIVTLVPFIGSLATIGSAIKAVGAQVTPKLKGKYSSLGKWLQEVLGKNHVEQLLEILWKDPHQAEFLYLDALLEDLNSRKNLESPLLFLMDHFEYVDTEATHWRYAGKQITEAELWCVFLSSLSNCVGVMASRKGVVESPEHKIEDSELTELDMASCIELLNLRKITDSKLQERIVSVSGGNPFVIGTLCDMAESNSLSLSSVESLRSDTLEEVRLKTWRRLFNEVQDLQELVNRAGLLPYFDRNVMNTIAPTMNIDQWTRMVGLSFAKNRGDGTYVMHDLARELVVAELGDRFRVVADEVAELLEKTSEAQDDPTLLGLSISVQGLYSPEFAIHKISEVANNLSWRGQFRSAVELLDSVNFGELREQTLISWIKAHHLTALDRVAEAEHLFKDAIAVLEELAESDPKSNKFYLAQVLNSYGNLLRRIKKPIEADAMFERALELTEEIDLKDMRKHPWVFSVYWWYSLFLIDMHRLNKAADLLQRALDLEKFGRESSAISRERAFTLSYLCYTLLLAGNTIEAEKAAMEIPKNDTEYINRMNRLQYLGHIYRLTSRFQEANRAYRDLFDMYQTASFQWRFRAAYIPRHFALVMKFAGNYADAEIHYREILDHLREAAQDTPEVYLHRLSQILNDLAVLYYEKRQFSEARECYEEAMGNYERLLQDWPDLFEKYIAWILNNYSILLQEADEADRAQKFFHEALEIARVLARKFPENVFHLQLLGQILNNLGVLHRTMNKNDEAEKALHEALEVREALAKKNPEMFLGSVATTLNNLGVHLSTANRVDEARFVFLKGTKIRAKLAEKSPEFHNGRLGFILNNLGNIHKLNDEHSKAEEYYLDALDILENLAARVPSVYERYFKMVLSNLLLHYMQRAERKKADSIKRRLEALQMVDFAEQEIWIEEKDTEVGVFYDTSIS